LPRRISTKPVPATVVTITPLLEEQVHPRPRILGAARRAASCPA
jgi:hypothetical protein